LVNVKVYPPDSRAVSSREYVLIPK